MKATLFDLDGTLVDNMQYHFRAWREVAADLGIALDDARIQREFAGKKNDEIIPALLARAVTAAEIAEIAAKKESRYRELYRDHVTLVRGALAYMDKSETILAIASAAPPENRKMVLDALGIRARFEAIVGGEEAKRGKPAPDIFLLAAERISVPPSECLVFEDAVLGVQAAVAAGMRVIGVTTSEPAHELIAAGALRTIKDFTEL